MKIRVYQINRERDKMDVAFLSLEKMMKRTKGKPDWSIYDCVYEGDMEFDDLEEVFIEFNLYKPTGFTGHSLPVSDVVMTLNDDWTKSSYYCDSVGWEKI